MHYIVFNTIIPAMWSDCSAFRKMKEAGKAGVRFIHLLIL